MKRFVLKRIVDETGVSGTGVVAEGVKFSDGTVCLRWLTKQRPSSLVFYETGIASVEEIHGHGGSTVVEWIDEE